MIGGDEDEPILILISIARTDTLHQLICASVAIGDALCIQIIVVGEGNPVAAAIRPLVDTENTVHIRVDCAQKLTVQIIFTFAVQVFERQAFFLGGFYFAFISVGKVRFPQAVEAGGNAPARKLQQGGWIRTVHRFHPVNPMIPRPDAG